MLTNRKLDSMTSAMPICPSGSVMRHSACLKQTSYFLATRASSLPRSVARSWASASKRVSLKALKSTRLLMQRVLRSVLFEVGPLLLNGSL